MEGLVKLYIGNKTYSSWSMRPWVLMQACNIAFEEVFVPFDGFDAHHEFKKRMKRLHASATVPLLEADGLMIGDSLAIAEYLFEHFPNAGVWPEERQARAKARLLAAIMHSGFGALRSHCLMNIGADLSEVGTRLYEATPSLRADMALLESLLTPHLEVQADGGFLFGAYSAADAFYAPVMTRIQTYGLPVSPLMKRYQRSVLSHDAVRLWYDGALAENSFLAFEEPYRSAPTHNK